MPTATEPRQSILDTDEVRVDGLGKVRGEAVYTADFSRPGTLWAAFVTSAVPHGRIRSWNTEAARSMPGVRAVLTGADIPHRYLGRVLMDWPVLAHDKVHFIGQYVAAVAADTLAIAQAAAGTIDVVYDELSALFEPSAALAGDAVVIHEDRSSYPYLPNPPSYRGVPAQAHPNIQGRLLVERGESAAAFQTAVRVFEHRFATPSHHGGYIEPHATLVWIDRGEDVHVVSTCKSPYQLQRQLAVCAGLPIEKIIVEQAPIGGDFGAKGLSIDDFPCYFLAKATGRPVKSVRTHLDDVRSTNVRHAAEMTLRSGIDASGTITAFDLRVVYNGGAYAAAKPVEHLLPGSFLAKTPYRLPNARAELIAVYTNTVPAGHVRSPGDLQIIFALESHMDMIARELGVDPIAFRRAHLLADDEPDLDGLPYIRPRGHEILEILCREGAWAEPLPAGRGKGVAITAHHIGHGTAQVRMILSPDGQITIRTPMADQGVGALTMLQRTAAETIGIGTERVRVLQENSTSGLAELGPGATRVTAVTGRACQDAARQIRAALTSSGWNGAPNTYGPAVRRACAATGFVDACGAFTHKRVAGKAESANFSGYLVDLSVDMETGEITLHDVVYVADVGTVINPLSHQGQIDGGFVFGLGHALMEELLLEDGRILNLSLADYKLPVQKDLPPFRSFLLPTRGGPGPFEAKAIGESSTSAIAPAIANAVERACGVRVVSLPITAERIYHLLQTPR